MPRVVDSPRRAPMRCAPAEEHIRFRQHLPTEMAHYAADCWDAEVFCSLGRLGPRPRALELVGPPRLPSGRVPPEFRGFRVSVCLCVCPEV